MFAQMVGAVLLPIGWILGSLTWITHLFFFGTSVFSGNGSWLFFLLGIVLSPVWFYSGVCIWLHWLFDGAYIPLVTPVLLVTGYID